MQLPEFWPGQRSAAAGCSEDSLSEGGGGGGREEEQLQLRTKQLLKEAREKSGGWESRPAPEHVELDVKKVKERRLHVDSGRKGRLHRMKMMLHLMNIFKKNDHSDKVIV